MCRNPSLTGDGRWTDTYWPLHTPLKREILTLSVQPSTILEGHRVRKCAFWKKFLPQLGNDYFEEDDTSDNHTEQTDTVCQTGCLAPDSPLCATTKDIFPVRQDLMILHTAAFVLFIIAFVLLVVKISFMVASVVIKACSHQSVPHQRSEMTSVVLSSY